MFCFSHQNWCDLESLVIILYWYYSAWNKLVCQGASCHLNQTIKLPVRKVWLPKFETWMVFHKNKQTNKQKHGCVIFHHWRSVLSDYMMHNMKPLVTTPMLWHSKHGRTETSWSYPTTSTEQVFLQHFSLIVWNLLGKKAGHWLASNLKPLVTKA